MFIDALAGSSAMNIMVTSLQNNDHVMISVPKSCAFEYMFASISLCSHDDLDLI